VELRHNQPAIIRIANADDRPRVFNAPKFFPAALRITLTRRRITYPLRRSLGDLFLGPLHS
jgi:hypothetical protein